MYSDDGKKIVRNVIDYFSNTPCVSLSFEAALQHL